MKIKSLNLSGFLTILKCCLLCIVATLIGIVLFAVVLKFVDLNSTVVAVVNDVIKAISIFLCVFLLRRKIDSGLVLKSAFSGLIYGLLTYIIFSILNGGFSFGMSVVIDLLFALIVAVIASIMLNLVRKH